jgi:hypothetical protein
MPLARAGWRTAIRGDSLVHVNRPSRGQNTRRQSPVTTIPAEGHMTFHVQFNYQQQDRERLLRFLHQGGLETSDGVKLHGSWLSLQTGTGYAVLETDDASGLYELCSVWSEYGQLSISPVVPLSEI